MADIVEAASQTEEDAAFEAGAKIVIRTDLLPPPPPPPPAFEDLDTYNDADPSDRLAVDGHQVTFTNMDRANETLLYRDFGEAYFGSFNVDFTFNMKAVSSGGSNMNGGLVSFANEIGNREALRIAAGDLLGVLSGNSGTTRFMCLTEIAGGAIYNSTFFNPALNTNYYCTLSRDMNAGAYGTLSLRIYSDQLRSKLIKTLTLALHKMASFRYLYAVQSQNNNLDTVFMSGVVSDIAIY